MKNISIYLCIVFILTATNMSAQRSIGDMYADSVQVIRTTANASWKDKEHPTPAELEKSINLLLGAITYLDQPEVKTQALGNSYLFYRRSDVYQSLTNLYTLAKQYDKAIAAFSKAYETAKWDRSGIEKDSLYKDLIGLPECITLLERYKARTKLWNNGSFKTPFNPAISEDEKIAGLSLLWAQAKYNFVFIDKLTTDWNKIYLDYIPLVKATKDTKEYYRVLMQFYAQLQDGHTNVFPPDELAKDFYSRPPVRTELIEGRVFITNVSSPALEKTGIVPGLEILKIDGVPVLTYAGKNVRPYLSSSTDQDMIVREFSYNLLRGEASNPVTLELKDRNGKTRAVRVNRSGYTDVKKLPSISFTTIGNTGYLVLNSFSDDSLTAKYDSLFPEIAKTKNLVIDIRYNGGGEGSYGYHILRTLTDKAFKTSLAKTTVYEGYPVPGTKWIEQPQGSITPDRKRFYDKPIVLLIGPRTFSAAEDFAIVFEDIKRGQLVGESTGGSTGQPLHFDLPGGGSARVCMKKDLSPNGKEFVGIGIMPDINVPLTIKAIYEGKDEVLLKALSLLNKN
ncbi:S41 family peptidase [Terrimonas rubra]|uniref:S41 family peptidase n=1 Tax=Terrimonas rubra TaxID=1035890 RepID=A0ABW6ACB7_9BACT